MSFGVICAGFFIFSTFGLTETVRAGEPLPVSIAEIVKPCLGDGKATGIVVGIVTPRGEEYYGFGRARRESREKPDEKTLFEIGSISKLFTNLLLEDEALKNRIHMDDPVTQYLPPGCPFPKPAKSAWTGFRDDPGRHQVTLWQLATHTSGFPEIPGEGDLPAGYNPKEPANVTLEMGREFLRKFTFSWEPGTHYEYSSINIALLGYVLSLREKQEVETLIRSRILDPLGMGDTRITLSPGQAERLAEGYSSDGKPASFIGTSMDFAAGGSFKSTAADLVKFAAYSLGLRTPNPLAPAMAEQQRLLDRLSGGPSRSISYFLYPHEFGNILSVRARTMGFRGCLALVPSRKLGVVILTNWNDLNIQPVMEKVARWAVGKMEAKTAGESRKTRRAANHG